MKCISTKFFKSIFASKKGARRFFIGYWVLAVILVMSYYFGFIPIGRMVVTDIVIQCVTFGMPLMSFFWNKKAALQGGSSGANNSKL